jgi:hypothetical protein
MTEDRIILTRRLVLGASALAGVTALSAPGAAARDSAAPSGPDLVDRLQGDLHGTDLERLIDVMHSGVRTIAWTGAQELDVVGPAAYRDTYLAPYLEANSDFKMSITKVLTNGTEMVTFYDVAATVDGNPSAWSGCNVYFTDGERIAGFVSMLAPDAVQTSWEPEGIILLPDPKTISARFQEGLLKVIPDFWETVRRQVIIGNMLVLMQVPSGNLVLPDDKTKYCAWYNCDVFFFDNDRIKYILFQRDVMYDQSQTAI